MLPRANFCSECGTALSTASDPAEYKQVTVLFADVVRSMEIAAALDVERLREIMTELVERSAAVVRRYGGTAEYNGDGVMALFGAPVALEDHAFRACLAALEIQQEATRLAAEVARRDGVTLRLRVGLNSGRVIAGQIGSGSLGYAATGEHVGLAQRMESAAPAGAVMLSDATAQLVEHLVVLAEPEWVRIKGAGQPVRARRLVQINPRGGLVNRVEASLVGRRWELAALEAMAERAMGARGGVVTVMGPPGIGKSRMAREIAALTADRGIDVFWTFCESHARDISFGVVARLLRAGNQISDLDGEAARTRLRATAPSDAEPEDLLLLDDLLGIADPDVPLPQIDPDARRRRLTALIKSMSLARNTAALYVIEDAHWIDAVSESMLADVLRVIPQTKVMVLITARPEYRGMLAHVPGGQTIALAALGDSDTVALISELLGSDPSVSELSTVIAERAAGNPFFAEEMVRELVQRGVLDGEHGSYICRTDVADVTVPATVQAAIEARLDRLTSPAKRTLHAASVIGARFDAGLLTALGIDPTFHELLTAELIDQVKFGPNPEFAFRHPLIRAVAYESQLKSDRADLHRRLAAAIQESAPEAVDEQAPLIAEHLESAGELHAAYDWHLRAATWSTNRNIAAARVSWERARLIADALPADDADQLSMRIAPRAMLCATDWQAQALQEGQGRFAELRQLCGAAGDDVSLAIGMSGLGSELLLAGRSRQGSRLASEQMALLESIGDPNSTIGLAFIAFVNWFNTGEVDEILRWSQYIIDLAGGDPSKGASFGIGSPLAIAVTFRGIARCWRGVPGWRQDLDDAVTMARNNDPATLGIVIPWTYGLAIRYGSVRADDAMMRTLEEAVQTALRASSDVAVLFTEYALGVALLCRGAEADRRRGLELAVQALDWQRSRMPSLVPTNELLINYARAQYDERDAAILAMRKVLDELDVDGRVGYGVWGTSLLVETLLARGTDADLVEAQQAIDRWTKVSAGAALPEITLLRLRALQAHAHGDDVGYRNLARRYLAMAKSLAFEGHIDWAEAMVREIP
ncbi:ATP-binding protein [Mycobacterium intermedium]|nr:adenylate/guanylate cyclase domain-containing protein [Mycobacterium intermedium]